MEYISGLPVQVWIDLFYLCHEWRWDGGEVERTISKTNVRKFRTGQYCRVEWPGPGTAIDQMNIVTEVFRIIKDEEAKMTRLTIYGR